MALPAPQAIGTYWHGLKLSRFEQVCLLSMLKQGHSVTLFCHDNVKGVPEGVEIRDAREITGDKSILMYKRDVRKNKSPNPALFANLFRYKMINKLGMIWLDLDVFLLKELIPSNGYLFGWEGIPNAWENRDIINNAVLALPYSSPTLKNLIDFCDDEYPIPPFFSWRYRCKLDIMKRIGKPVHVSYQKWGVWGPGALSYFLHENDEAKYAMKGRFLYPINNYKPNIYFLPSDKVQTVYLKDALCIHISSHARKYFNEVGIKNIPKGSFLSNILNEVI